MFDLRITVMMAPEWLPSTPRIAPTFREYGGGAHLLRGQTLPGG